MITHLSKTLYETLEFGDKVYKKSRKEAYEWWSENVEELTEEEFDRILKEYLDNCDTLLPNGSTFIKYSEYTDAAVKALFVDNKGKEYEIILNKKGVGGPGWDPVLNVEKKAKAKPWELIS